MHFYFALSSGAFPPLFIYCALYYCDVAGFPSTKQPDEVIDFVKKQDALAGGEVIIECCSPDIASAIWTYSAKPNEQEFDVITNGKVQPGFEHKLRLDRSIAGCHNLVIHRAIIEDSGVYKCIDENGDPERPNVTVLHVRERQSYENSKDSTSAENVANFADGVQPSQLTGNWPQIFIGVVVFGILTILTILVLVCLICVVVKSDDARNSLKQHCACNNGPDESPTQQLGKKLADYKGDNERPATGEERANAYSTDVVVVNTDTVVQHQIIQMDKVVHGGVRNICDWQIELQELILMRAYTRLYLVAFSNHYWVPKGEKSAFEVLSSVSSVWWNTLQGWQESTTKHWFKHKLQATIRSKCHPLRRRLVTTTLKTAEENHIGVIAVTWMSGFVYVVCNRSEYIRVLEGDKLRPPIYMRGLGQPSDIVACCEVNALYVSDEKRSIRRAIISDVGTICSLFIKLEAVPKALSVRSCKLLVCMRNSNILKRFARDGHSIGEVKMPDSIEPLHAIETYHETVVVCHEKTIDNHVISEFKFDGSLVRNFDAPVDVAILKPCHMSLGTDGEIFVVDRDGYLLFLLSNNLELKRILFKTNGAPTKLSFACSKVTEVNTVYYVAGFSSSIHKIPLTKRKAKRIK